MAATRKGIPGVGGCVCTPLCNGFGVLGLGKLGLSICRHEYASGLLCDFGGLCERQADSYRFASACHGYLLLDDSARFRVVWLLALEWGGGFIYGFMLIVGADPQATDQATVTTSLSSVGIPHLPAAMHHLQLHALVPALLRIPSTPHEQQEAYPGVLVSV